MSDCYCNIIDSCIVILGNEFIFIMLLVGDMFVISWIEYILFIKGMEFGLLIMMKCIVSYIVCEFCVGYIFEYMGIDILGILSKVICFFVDNNISICLFKLDIYEEDNELKMCCELEFNIFVDVDIDNFKVSFEDFFCSLNVDYIFRCIC